MPEGDTIFRAARTLDRALSGKLVTRFETVLPYLARVHEDTPVTGRTIESVRSLGKWIQMNFSGDLVLLTHMLMSGSWHIYRPGERWKRRREDMRIFLATAEIEAVAFKVPVAEFHSSASLARARGFSGLGQDILAADFNAEAAAELLKRADDMEIGEALLKQSLLAGIGNVYKSEICFACGVNPYRKCETLTDEEVRCLVSYAREFLTSNVSDTSGEQIVTYTGLRRTTGRNNPSDRLWVYGRGGEPCRKCGTAIRKYRQGSGARVTFWCPTCQH